MLLVRRVSAQVRSIEWEVMRRASRYRPTSSLLMGVIFFAGSWSLAQEARFILRGEVRSDTGSPMAVVEVRLKGEGLEQQTFTDMDGTFEFEIPAGVYELVFRSFGFYETVVRGIAIRKQPLNRLKIVLPWLSFERDLEIISPKRVPAPALEISFEPEFPLKVGHPMRGRVMLKNVGREPILIPTVPFTKDSQYSSEAKIMQLVVDVKGYYDYYDEKYICLPSKNCKELAPSETISFPITIYHREGYYKGKRVVQVYPRRGEYKLTVGVHFMLPGTDHNTRTQPIEKEFTVLICDGSSGSRR